MCKINGQKIAIDKKTSQEDFYKFINKIMKSKVDKLSDDLDYKYILAEIEKESFLPKQISKKNSEIPYQLRKLELEQILSNVENDFPFLKNKDEKGLTVKDKIISLLTFKIPYYIGVVNDSYKNKFPDRCWVVKKDTAKNEKITPWNFFDIVDEQKTAEAFITSRTNKCTYLIGEDVLPKNSLLYSEYTVLNEINNLKISVNGKDIFNIKLKEDIFNEVFKITKKVTQKTIEKFLKTEGRCSKDDKIIITGVDKECTTNLSSYIELKKIFGLDIEKQSVKDMLENIILWSTIYDEGEGKKILEFKIKKEYPSLSKNNLKQILNLKFSGWGRLSKKFLTEIISDFTGFNEKINIITAMRKTNSNLMELLSDNYNFKNSIEKFNGKFKSEKESLSYNNLVKNLYVSPSVKRMMWQSLCIVKELKKIQGNHEPKKIFVEMARGEELNKGRTKSRQKKLEELYENCKENANEWSTDISSLKDKVKNVDNLKLRSDKLYLYYTQMGKCMCTGREIDLNNLMNKNGSLLFRVGVI